MENLLFPKATDLVELDKREIRNAMLQAAAAVREALNMRKADLRNGAAIYIDLPNITDDDVISLLCAELGRAGYQARKRNDNAEQKAIAVQINTENQ
jgi:hypothetical protein